MQAHWSQDRASRSCPTRGCRRAAAASLHLSPSLAQRQSAEIDTEIPHDYVPTQAEIAELKDIERVVRDKEDTCMDTDNPEDEEDDTLASVVA